MSMLLDMRNVAIALSLTGLALGAQPSAASPYEAPLRELPWGQLNFLHTTDTHGWHGGHIQEPSFSADWGDYVSFAHHLRAKADKDGVDILLVDTGDRVEGNGLYDASEPKGKYTFDIFKQQTIDVICSGNHELYKANASRNEFYITVPNFNGSYLASNIDVYNKDTGDYEALAQRYKRFTTKNQGIRVTAFGFLYDFQQAAENTRVTLVEDVIKKDWFKEAIRGQDTDIFLVTGHVAVRSKEFDMIFKAIRAVQWDVAIYFLGGHTHIRDFKTYDNKAAAIESGRYMETIGFASVSGLRTEKSGLKTQSSNPTFERRYIDNNLYSFQRHTNLTKETFPTELGKNVSSQIAHARSTLKLDKRHGCAPQTYWVSRAEINSSESIFTWLGNEVIPDSLSSRAQDARPKLVVTNTGALRFDVFEGPFTHDTAFLVSPFTSGFRRIKDVQYKVAAQLLQVLNQGGNVLRDLDPTLDWAMFGAPPLQGEQILTPPSFDMQGNPADQALLKDEPSLKPGYTTKDDKGDDGDDTVHSPIKFYRVPNCIGSQVDYPHDTVPDSVDVVYNEFIQPWIILALRFLGVKYGSEDTQSFMDGTSLTDVISGWVEQNWPCDDDHDDEL